MVILNEIVVLKLQRNMLIICYHRYMNDWQKRIVYQELNKCITDTTLLYVVVGTTIGFTSREHMKNVRNVTTLK